MGDGYAAVFAHFCVELLSGSDGIRRADCDMQSLCGVQFEFLSYDQWNLQAATFTQRCCEGYSLSQWHFVFHLDLLVDCYCAVVSLGLFP